MSRRSLVAVLSTYYRPVVGGVETATERLARFLVSRGLPVVVVTKRVSHADATSEVLDDVPVERVSPTGERRGSGKWLAIPSFLMALWRRRHSLRVIVCVDYRGIGIAALMAGLLTGAPVVFETSTDGTISGEAVRRRITRLGASADGPLARALTWPIRATYRRADLFVCVSHTIERELLECGVPPSRIQYLPHTVDTRAFRVPDAAEKHELRRARGIPAAAIVAVFVGRLSREKGVMELLDAWTTLDVPGTHLVLVGPDMPGHPWDAGRPAREWVASHGLASTVTFAGGVESHEVPSWLQMADVSVQPSHFEAFGIAAAEAMAVGLPVIATDVGGYRDYVDHGVNGLRVPPEDAAALREGLRRLLTDAATRQRMGIAALATAQRFDEAVIFDRFTQLLDTVSKRA